MRWIKDEDFIRGDIPMTKYEVRSIAIALLEIESGDRLLDIGGGTGSVAIESSLQGAYVYTVEKEKEGVELIGQNADKFGVENIEILEGIAPDHIKHIESFNKCFIGGSGKRLEDIVDYVTEKIDSGGIVIANFVTLDNLHQFQSLLKDRKYMDIETRLIQVSSVSSRAGIMTANNPVFIVKGRKI